MNNETTGLLSVKATVWELICRVARAVLKDNCDGYAAQIAFFFLFALFPCLLTLTTLLAYLPVPDLFQVLLRIVGRFVPVDVLVLVEENLCTLVSVQQGGLLSIGILLSLWTSSNAVISVQIAMNEAYGIEEQRPYWKVRLISVYLVIAFTLFIITSLLLLIFGPLIGIWLASLANLGDAFTMAWNLLRWPVILGLMMAALSTLYRYAPAIPLPWREITPGAATATVAWAAVTLAFSFYVNNFGSYNKTYGSIGAVIALLIWMYASAFLVLLGAEINAHLGELLRERKCGTITQGNEGLTTVE